MDWGLNKSTFHGKKKFVQWKKWTSCRMWLIWWECRCPTSEWNMCVKVQRFALYEFDCPAQGFSCCMSTSPNATSLRMRRMSYFGRFVNNKLPVSDFIMQIWQGHPSFMQLMATYFCYHKNITGPYRQSVLRIVSVARPFSRSNCSHRRMNTFHVQHELVNVTMRLCSRVNNLVVLKNRKCKSIWNKWLRENGKFVPY